MFFLLIGTPPTSFVRNQLFRWLIISDVANVVLSYAESNDIFFQVFYDHYWKFVF